MPLPQAHHLVHQAKLDLYIASTGMSFSVFRRFRELVREVDIVHYHFPWPMMDLMHFAVHHNKPSVVTYHSDIVKQAWLSRLYRPLMTRFLSDVDRIVATSPNYAQTSLVLKKFGDKVRVIPIGIPENRPKVRPEVEAQWRQLVGGGFFLFVGAPRYYKGLDYLIEAARITGMRVVIAGATFDEVPAAVGVKTVKVVGRVDDEAKEALLNLCAGFVLPSHLRSEAFGVVLAEAARAGRPMITCEIGTGTTYVNVHGETGLVIAPADAEALGSAMVALNSDESLRERLGRGAATRFGEVFESRAMGRAYADLYAQLAQ